MAQVFPFVGTRFNLEKVGDISQLVTPPYDVITPEMQDNYYKAHPQNIVRIDYGKDVPTDTNYENRYTRASNMLEQWRNENILVQDERRTFTAYEQTFALPDGSTRRRRGIFAMVKLEDFGKGSIHAHERTLEGPKCDRYKLMRATESNTSSIFSIYSDPEKTVDSIIDQESKKKPWAEWKDDAGVQHRVWVISGEKACKTIVDCLADKELFIADGHHRYETSLNYRDEMRSQLNRHDGMQPFDFTLMYLSNADDEGMTILPIHRALSREMDDGVDLDEFLAELKQYFKIATFELDLKKEGEGLRLAEHVASLAHGKPTFGMVLNDGRAVVVTLRKGLKLREILERPFHKSIRLLDVTVLHELIIRQTWVGNPEVEFDDHDIHYSHNPENLLDLLRRRKASAVFIVNPPSIEQMMAVARAGKRMPPKSTFFYPKVITGIVLREMSLRA